MQQEKKRIRSVWKYHFDKITVCRETDVVFTRCRVCKELKPSNLEYFRKDTTNDAQRLIQPLCNECARKSERAQREIKRIEEDQKPISNVEQKELFDWKIFTKEDVQKETLESKIDKIFNFLWLNKWAYKK